MQSVVRADFMSVLTASANVRNWHKLTVLALHQVRQLLGDFLPCGWSRSIGRS